jgi:hypothetical protein
MSKHLWAGPPEQPERKDAVAQAIRDAEEPEAYWREQGKLSLLERDDMWWTGVALPNALLAFVVVVAVVAFVVGFF